MRVAVLMGGSSEERGVSLASGCQVAAALRSAGHHVDGIDSAKGLMSRATERRILESGIARTDADAPHRSGDGAAAARVVASEPALRQADVAFLALHGGAGEDGTLQTLLETAGVPYAGSGPVGCALSMDKDLTKRLLRDAGIPTPDWAMVRPAGELGDGVASGEADGAEGAGELGAAARLGLPLVVKPVSGGSSVRLTLVRSEAETARAVADAAGAGDRVMCEAYVEGREFTVAVLDREALPVVEIEPVRELFDFDCKYEDGMARETAPAPIPPELTAELQSAAVRVHRLLRLRHFSRVDFMVDRGGTAWCLEANALPGLTRNSLVPKAAAAAGIEFPELCERICRLGMRRSARRSLPALVP